MKIKKPAIDGIALKKYHGQNFLQDSTVVHDMLSAVKVKGASVFEIGCGNGFLTHEIIKQQPERLVIFEIDTEWAEKIGAECKKFPFVTMNCINFLDIDDLFFRNQGPWMLLSNLPYHVTFPILKKVQKNRDFIQEGVVMVQEEVAQKIIKEGGRGYGYISLYYQYYFDWKLLTKVPPTAFYPAPKVFSRLMHFVPKRNVVPIPQEEEFWAFIKLCFAHPRRTLRNNLSQTHFDISGVDEKTLGLRAQQMSFDDLLSLWKSFFKQI